MHGQKKRRKRSMEATVRLEGHDYSWILLSEPQWTTEGAIGLRVSVRLADAVRRELIVDFPFDPSAFVPQRPTVTSSIVVAAIQAAQDDGWDPQSKGRAYHFSSSIRVGAGKSPSANSGIQRAALNGS
jgi:hypothetical protein